MTDSITNDGEVNSKTLALSIINEIGLEPNDETLDPVTDAVHRLLEANVPDGEVHSVLSELASELQRAGSLNNSFEESEMDDDEEPEYDSGNLFSRREDDDY